MKIRKMPEMYRLKVYQYEWEVVSTMCKLIKNDELRREVSKTARRLMSELHTSSEEYFMLETQSRYFEWYAKYKEACTPHIYRILSYILSLYNHDYVEYDIIEEGLAENEEAGRS